MEETASLQGKRIVLVFGSLDLGGAERQGLLLAETLKNGFHANIQIWGLEENPGRVAQLCDEKGIPWRGVAFDWGKTGLTRSANLFKFACLLKKEKPDVILSYTALPNLVCGIIWKFAGAKLFVWNQRDEGLQLRNKVWNRFAVRSTRCFISNSVNGKLYLEKTYDVNPDSIVVINNGVELPVPRYSRNEWRDKLGLSESCLVACMVANIHPVKDHATLLKAWAVVVKRMAGFRVVPMLLLAGRADSGVNELQQLASDLCLGDRVKFLGKVDDVYGLLGASDLYIQTSISEGVPNAVLEAMAVGLPVVGTDIAGIRAALGPLGITFLAPVGDSLAIAGNICQLFENADLRVATGKMFQERIAAEFTLSNMCGEMISYLAKRLV